VPKNHKKKTTNEATGKKSSTDKMNLSLTKAQNLLKGPRKTGKKKNQTVMIRREEGLKSIAHLRAMSRRKKQEGRVVYYGVRSDDQVRPLRIESGERVKTGRKRRRRKREPDQVRGKS